MKEDAPHDATLFNLDVTSILLNNQSGAPVFVSKEGLEALKASRRGVARTGNQPKTRAVQLMTLVSAAGRLVTTVVLIRDRKIKEAQRWQVFNLEGVTNI